MNGSVLRAIAGALVLACLAGCAPPVGPAGQPSGGTVNPETGSRPTGR